MCLLLCKEEDSSSVFFSITERCDMGLYEVPMSKSLLCFGMGTMLANFHMCGIMLVLRAVLNMLVRNASRRGYFMCFSVNGYICLVCCVSDSELFGETIRNRFGCGCYFIVECYGSVECGWRSSVG